MEGLNSSIILGVSLILIVSTLRSAINVIRSIQYFNNNTNSCPPVSNADWKDTSLWLVIPVYEEQDRIIPALNYFSKLVKENQGCCNVHILIVTTARERSKGTSTWEVMADTISAINKEHKTEFVKWIHDSRDYGWKPHQLNWSIDKLLNQNTINPSKVLFGVYDVDAKPNIQTLNALFQIWSRTGEWPEIIQQLSVYYPEKSQGVFNTIWGALAALWQTRFTLDTEKPMISKSGSGHLPSLSWCIGNGIFVRLDFLNRIGGFTEQYYTEDIEFGYRVSLKNVRITSLSVFLETGNPITLVDDIFQKSKWFQGLFDYLSYARTHHDSPITKRYWLSFLGVVRGMKWLGLGPMIALLLLTPSWCDSNYSILVSITSALLFVWVGFISTWYAVVSSPYTFYSKQAVSRLSVFIGIIILGPIYVITYSFGPILCIAKNLWKTVPLRK